MSSTWLVWLVPIAIAVVALGVGGMLAARDPRVREFVEAIEDLGWHGVARGVWGLVRDSRVPWFVRAVPVPLLIYLATPIDIIPDFIPVIGQADDILVVAAALWIVLRWTPREVVAQHFPPRASDEAR